MLTPALTVLLLTTATLVQTSATLVLTMLTALLLALALMLLALCVKPAVSRLVAAAAAPAFRPNRQP